MGLTSHLRDALQILRGNFLILFLSWILMRFSDPLTYTYYSLFIIELGGSPYVIGLINSLSNIILALTQPFGGYVADFHGRRKIIVSMSFLLAFSNIFFILATNWIHVLIGSIISSASLIYIPALTALTADSLPPDKRGLGFSLQRMIGIVSVASPMIAGFLVLNYGIVGGVKLAYIISLILYFMAALVRCRLKETIEVNSYSSISASKLMFNVFHGIVDSIRNSPNSVLRFIFVRAFISLPMHMCFPFFLVYAKYVLGLGEIEWGLLITLYNLSSFISALIVGRFIDVFGRKIPLLLSLILQAIALPIFLYSNFNVLILLFIFWAIFDSILLVSSDAMFADITPRAFRGRIASLLSLFEYILMSIGSFFGGYLYEYLSPQLPFILSMILFLASAILLNVLISEPKVKEI
jgi:MFS family permease